MSIKSSNINICTAPNIPEKVGLIVITSASLHTSVYLGEP